jgi:phosphate transport system permease protein
MPADAASMPIDMAPPSRSVKVARAAAPPPRTPSRARWGDAAFEAITRLFALLVMGSLTAILVALAISAWPALAKFGPAFFVTDVWNPVKSQFGGLAPIYGTLVTSFIALAIGVPVSFGIAIFLTEMCPPMLKRPLGTAVELLAAIPSIIYGMWGLFVFAPWFADHAQPLLAATLGHVPVIGVLVGGPPSGIGLATAGIILSVMVIPFIASVMRDVFEVVPAVLKESAYGLGSTTWEVVWNVVLPYTRIGVIGGIMLGLGRALGETMAVTFVIGNAYRISAGLFNPGNSIASALANEFNEAADPVHRASLIALGLVLFALTFVVLAASRMLITRLQKGEGART